MMLIVPIVYALKTISRPSSPKSFASGILKATWHKQMRTSKTRWISCIQHSSRPTSRYLLASKGHLNRRNLHPVPSTCQQRSPSELITQIMKGYTSLGQSRLHRSQLHLFPKPVPNHLKVAVPACSAISTESGTAVTPSHYHIFRKLLQPSLMLTDQTQTGAYKPHHPFPPSTSQAQPTKTLSPAQPPNSTPRKSPSISSLPLNTLACRTFLIHQTHPPTIPPTTPSSSPPLSSPVPRNHSIRLKPPGWQTDQ